MGPFEDFEFRNISINCVGTKSEAKTTTQDPLSTCQNAKSEVNYEFFDASDTVSIKICNLDTKDDLRVLLDIENKVILLKYEKDGQLDSIQREMLTNCIIYNIMKKNLSARYD